MQHCDFASRADSCRLTSLPKIEGIQSIIFERWRARHSWFSLGILKVWSCIILCALQANVTWMLIWIKLKVAIRIESAPTLDGWSKLDDGANSKFQKFRVAEDATLHKYRICTVSSTTICISRLSSLVSRISSQVRNRVTRIKLADSTSRDQCRLAELCHSSPLFSLSLSSLAYTRATIARQFEEATSDEENTPDSPFLRSFNLRRILGRILGRTDLCCACCYTLLYKFKWDYLNRDFPERVSFARVCACYFFIIAQFFTWFVNRFGALWWQIFNFISTVIAHARVIDECIQFFWRAKFVFILYSESLNKPFIFFVHAGLLI